MPYLNFLGGNQFLDFSQMPPNIHTLEVDLSPTFTQTQLDATAPKGLMTRTYPNLKVLILNGFLVSNTLVAQRFWESHPGIEKLIGSE